MKKYTIPALIVSTVFLFSCKNKTSDTTEIDTTVLTVKADSLIKITFDTLRNSLMNAIAKNNFEGAIGFCNTAATTLTNTYAAEGISIRRTSEKYRSPANAPDSMEQRILTAFHQLKNTQVAIQPVLEEDKQGNHHYFKPIIIQAMCLSCHGSKSEQILPATWQSIQQKYPDDMAYDYKEGDLRGMWHVIFAKK